MNDNNDNWWREPAEIADTPPATRRQRVRPAAGGQKAKIAGALILGGIAGAAILGPIATLAASPTPAASSAASTSPAASAATGGSGTSGAASPTAVDQDQDGNGTGGHVEAASDTSVVAKAIGISEADLLTALQGGQTVADVAKAHNVALQTVIDALVADGQAELDAQVKAGTLTQAQADAKKADLVTRATDQANGSFEGGH